MDTDKATLIKSDSIITDEDSTLIVMYYYHREYTTDDKGHKHTIASRSFYRCSARLDSDENWKKLANSIKMQNPAEYFNLRNIGLDDDMILTDTGKIWTNQNACTWINLKISKNKKHTVEEFVNGHRILKKCRGKRIKFTPGAFTTDLPYVRVYTHDNNQYDITTPQNFPRGVWLTVTKTKQPRRKPKIIKD